MSNGFPREILNSDPVQLELFERANPVRTVGRPAFRITESNTTTDKATEEARIMLAIFRALGG